MDGGHGTRFNTEARSHGGERCPGVGSRPGRAGWGRRVNRADASHERRRRGLRLPDSLASPCALRARPTPTHRVSHGGNQLVLSVRLREPRGSVLFFVNSREWPARPKPHAHHASARLKLLQDRHRPPRDGGGRRIAGRNRQHAPEALTDSIQSSHARVGSRPSAPARVLEI